MPTSQDVPALLNAIAGTNGLDEPAALAVINSNRTVSGRAKQSDATILYGLPGCVMAGVSTQAMTAGQVVYQPITPLQNITIDSYIFEVTATPASGANVRTGIYLADGDLQPTGTPLLDSGVAVANGFTGVKTTSSLSVPLLAFRTYLVAVNVDVIMTLRVVQANSFGGSFMPAALGATPCVVDYHATQTYGAYPATGDKWTAAAVGSAALRHFQFFRWTAT